MNLYEYRAIITKTMLLGSKVTFTDKRFAGGVLSLPLDSRCITGHVLGEDERHAKQNATKRLKQGYPEELGYRLPSDMRVIYVEEEVIGQ